MAYTPLIPAQLAFDDAGTPWSQTYQDIYHSADGGLGQARHVFLGGNGLPQRWQGRNSFTILETGFGLGLNFLATWQAWRADPQRPARLHFVSMEKHPFSLHDLKQLHQRWPELDAMATQLHAVWPPLAPGAHRLLLEGGKVTLTLFFGDAELLVRKIRANADALFLDGFAPQRNPDLWNSDFLKGVTRLCAPGATLATWSVAAEVRDGLSARRWKLDKRSGFGHKREMLCGVLYGESIKRPTPQEVLVVGAGLAGAAVAERLAARGCEVTVAERNPVPAMEASGNLAGLVHPMLARDDNLAARLSRAGYLFGLRQLADLAARDADLRWSPCGVLQIARDAVQEKEQRDTWEALGLPREYVDFLDHSAAEQMIGHTVAAGGWYYPMGGWINPPSMCRTLLRRHDEHVSVRYSTQIARLERVSDGWRAWSGSNDLLAESPSVVLANAYDAERLLSAGVPPLVRIRGQVSYLSAGSLPFLHHVLCGNGYVTPEMDGVNCLGATFDFEDEQAVSIEGHRINLAHLEGLLPGCGGIDVNDLTGRVAFRTTTADRMPLVGQLPDTQGTLRRQARLHEFERLPNLHALLALGSRGLTWAPIAAELLAAQMFGEPLPVEGDLVDALDPARYLMRELRQSAT